MDKQYISGNYENTHLYLQKYCQIVILTSIPVNMMQRHHQISKQWYFIANVESLAHELNILVFLLWLKNWQHTYQVFISRVDIYMLKKINQSHMKLVQRKAVTSPWQIMWLSIGSISHELNMLMYMPPLPPWHLLPHILQIMPRKTPNMTSFSQRGTIMRKNHRKWPKWPEILARFTKSK